MSLYTLEIGAARFAPLQKLRRNHRPYVWTETLSAAWFSFRHKSYPAWCEHNLTLQQHYLRWFTLYNKIYFWNIKSSCCDICGYQTTNFSITKTLPSQQNMTDEQLCFIREPIELTPRLQFSFAIHFCWNILPLGTIFAALSGAILFFPEKRGELRSFRPTAFARTLVNSPDDMRHSTTWWTYLLRCYFSYPWIPHVQALSFHAY